MIPDAAVKAAMGVLSMYIDERMSENEPNSPYTREGAIEIIEAAAPHLMAAAWDEAITKAHGLAWEHDGSAASAIYEAVNPYRKQADAD